MSSIIEGYNYDIFISYRQKDNKHDGWVTEFVDNLKGELESTFKEEVSVYFDINPHDGLLETHDVGESLKEKLKCVVFIPIISRTYCDPKSFAWEHEFKAFIELSSNDQYGLKVMLPFGNVSNRVLPVQIHDLDADDKKLVENELGGLIRGIEFIYKEQGVVRPLTAKDNEEKNLNKTSYRNQINKVALAIREMIIAIKKYNPRHEEVQKEVFKEVSASGKTSKTKIIAISLLLLTIIVLGYLIITKLTKPPAEIEKSIAVLPFANLGSDEDKAWFNDGITDIIINKLSKISDLRLLAWTSTQKYKEGKKSIADIGSELGVNYIIEGTVQWQGDKMRISVQLIRVLNEGHIWSDIYDRNWKDIFEVQSEIAQKIAEELKDVLTPEEKVQISTSGTQNPEAYNLYLQGRFFWYKRTEEGLKKSIEYFEKSAAIDPDYALAYAGLANAYFIQAWWGWYPLMEGWAKAKESALKAIDIDKNLGEAHAVLGELLSFYEWKWEEARKEFLIAIELNPNYSDAHLYYSELLDILRQNEEVRKEVDLAIKHDPFFFMWHASSASSYFKQGKLNEALDECRQTLELNPSYWSINWTYFSIYIKQEEDLKALESLQKIMLMDTLTANNSSIVKDVYNKSGMNGIFEWLIESELKSDSSNSWRLAEWYAILDKRDESLYWLEKAFKKRLPWIPRINNTPAFEKLRSEPRFQQMIKQMGLSEYQKVN